MHPLLSDSQKPVIMPAFFINTWKQSTTLEIFFIVLFHFMTGSIILLIFGVFCGSTAVLMIKATALNPVLLSALRQLGAAVLLLPFYLRDYRKQKNPSFRTLIKPSILPGLFLGIHFILWIIGARLTLAANSTLIVNLLPVVMPFFLYLLKKENVTGREIVGTIIAMSGVTFLITQDFSLGPETFLGDILCFVSMLFYALYLALAKRNSRNFSIWLYIVPLYFIGGMLCLVITLFIPGAYSRMSGMDLLMVVLLIIIPTVGGHTILNHSMRVIRGQLVALLNLGQFIFAAILAYYFFREVPDYYFYIATVLIILGAGTVILQKHQASTQ